MDDSASNPKVIGGGLLAAGRGLRRKRELEEHLRKSIALENLVLPLDPKERDEKRKLFDAICEIAIPALDELQREKENKRSASFTPPAIEMAKMPLAHSEISARDKDEEFRHSDDYCSIHYEGTTTN